MFNFKVRGNWDRTERFLKRAYNLDLGKLLEKYAQQGVEALSASTPVNTGLAASSWGYRIDQGKGE